MRSALPVPALLAALLLVPAAATAQDAGARAEAFTRCVRIKDDGERLACYDRLATELIEIGMQGDPHSTVAEAPAETPRAAKADPGPGAPYGQAAVAATDEQFGLERTEEGRKQDIERITSRYVGEFTGWDGDTLFTLENGQVWQQIQNGRLAWRATNPVVTIERGFFGSYVLSVEGVNRTVRVKRIK